MAANKDVKLSNILNISSNFQLERIDDEDAKDAGAKKRVTRISSCMDSSIEFVIHLNFREIFVRFWVLVLRVLHFLYERVVA